MASAAKQPASEKPTLHEIAAMPFPASAEAMRKHYVHDWGKPVPEGVTRKREFAVEVEFTVTSVERETVTVEAFSESEAEELASDKIALANRFADDCEIMNTKVLKGGEA